MSSRRTDSFRDYRVGSTASRKKLLRTTESDRSVQHFSFEVYWTWIKHGDLTLLNGYQCRLLPFGARFGHVYVDNAVRTRQNIAVSLRPLKLAFWFKVGIRLAEYRFFAR